MPRKSLHLLFILFLSFSFAGRGMSQTTATLAGQVSDQTGAVLPGAQVVVGNTSTGIKRSVATDSSGRFIASQLAPGPYEIRVTAVGFDTLVRQGIVLEIGQQANVSLGMKVGGTASQVTVTAEAPMVDTSSSSVSGVVNQTRIEELPLNGRDFSQLPLVQPGVSAVRNGDSTVSKGYGMRVSMGGSRPDQTAWLLDGTNVHSPSNFGTPGSAAGLMLGVDAVREFQVLTSDYGAELGGTSGGVVNMLSKSGTNQLHGTLFELLRNSAADARNFFDADKPPFKRNQFGGSFGGPVRKDRSFFFGSYEGLRQPQKVTNVSSVPSAAARLGSVAPEIRPYLELWPLPNGPQSGGGIATLSATANSPVGENYFVVRGDHHFNDKQSLFARFTFDQGTLTSPDLVPIYSAKIGTHTRYTTLQHDYIISPQLLTTTRAAYNRTLLSSDENPQIDFPKGLDLFYPGLLPQLAFAGATTFGPNSTNVVFRAQNLYDFQENVQYIRGNHSLKFGGEIEHIGLNKHGESAGLNGTFTWNSLADFLADNRLSAFSAAAKGSDTYRSYVQYIYGIYFQDDWKMRPNFTWNLGLRYEPYTAPTEKHGRLSTVKDWLTATKFDTSIGLFRSPAKKDFSPRVGFAWDPNGSGKTAVRAGFGVFFVDILNPYYGTPGQKGQPFFGSTASVLGNLATAAADVARITPSLLTPNFTPNTLLQSIQYNLNTSYEIKYNFAVERQLPGQISVSLGYLGDRGIHLWRIADVNDSMPIQVGGRPFVVTGTPRPNSLLGASALSVSDAQSFYNALQIEVKKRIGHGLQFQGSYTWSKNVDDSTTGIAATDFTPGGQGYTSQPYNPKADRGLSSLHQGQTLVLNGIYEIPSPIRSGLASSLLGGWRMASVFSASSGAPFSIYVSGRNAQDQSRFTGLQHPDRVAGRSAASIVTGNPRQYFDLTAFFLPPAGFYGNSGRNILLGPGLVNFDLSLHKSTPIHLGEGSRIEFHADAFNLFNRANFGIPRAAQSQVFNPATRTPIPGAGQITNTVSAARQMQFGLKLIF